MSSRDTRNPVHENALSGQADAPLRVLDLSTRAYNCLRRTGFDTVTDVAVLSDEQILDIRNIGVKTLEEISEKLAGYLNDHPLLEQRIASPASREPLSASEASPADRYIPGPEKTPITVLGVCTRTCNALKRASIDTVGQLAQMSFEEVEQVRNIGAKSLTEIEEKLTAYLAGHPFEEKLATSAELGQPTSESDASSSDRRISTDNVSISVLELSTRSYNALMRAGIDTISQLAQMSSQEIREVRNIGEKSVAEIEEKLEAFLAEHPKLEPAEHPVTSVSKSTIKPNLEPLEVSIDCLGLSDRTQEALIDSGFATIGCLLHALRKKRFDVVDVDNQVLKESKRKLIAYVANNHLPERQGDLQTGNGLLIEASLVARADEIPLDRISIKRLALSLYWQGLLQATGIETLDDLVWESPDSFRQDCSVKKRFRRYLTWLVNQGEPTWAQEVAGHGISPLHTLDLTETSLDGLIEHWFSSSHAIGDRDRQIVDWRYGLHGEPLTLQEVGDRLGVTRERVRQLENSVLRHLRGPKSRAAIRPLMTLLTHLLEEAGGLMTGEQIETALQNVFVIGNIDLIAATRLLFDVRDDISCTCKGHAWGLEGAPLARVGLIQVLLTGMLEEELVPLPLEEVIDAFKRSDLYQDRRGELRDSFILACLRSHPEISIDEEGQCSLEKWERHRLDEMILALREIGEPAHYTQIAEETNALLEPEIQTSAHNIHAHMQRLPDIFVRVGHGVYGLAEWGLHDDGSVANAARRVLGEANKPLHYDVIADRVLETWEVLRSSVHAALSTDDRFVQMGSGVYWLRERLAEGGEIAEADFGDLFGERLEKRQDEINGEAGGLGYDTHAEADAIRQMGTDFFS